MKIPTDFDVVSQPAPSFEKGTNYQDNPGVQPSEKAIPMTPGEKATNDTTGLSYNKAQNFGKGGSGYTKGS